ncbi:MAG: hypothetical protein GF364_16305, partial [Candidatus Lokiarchaeota archaeon]|nr:hypothetical protein [Candidatus Lokiarchaeota archaeon]
MALKNQKLVELRLKTLETLINLHPKLIEKVFNNLDITNPDLEKAIRQYNRKKILEACNMLFAYYSKYSLRDKIPVKIPDQVHSIDDNPEDVLQGIFSHYGHKITQKKNANGKFVWDWLGPNHDKEYAYHINR